MPMMLFIIVVAIGKYMPNNSRIIFITISGIIMQCVGVIFLLLILNNNMLSLKGTSIISEFKKWMQDFPFIKKSVNITPSSAAMVMDASSAYVFGSTKADTIEERINILEKEIDVIKKQIFDNKEELLNKINKKESESNKKFDSVDGELKKIQGKLEAAVIGDYRWQIFSAFIIFLGLMLTIYSIYIPLISNTIY
jgi:hypothetical protein